MRRTLFSLSSLAALILAAPGAEAQPPPKQLCPTGQTQNSYRCVPIPNSFVSILGDSDTVNAHLPPADDATLAVGPFPLVSPVGMDPFTGFELYRVVKGSVNVGTNGYLDFAAVASAAGTASNEHPGDANSPNDCAMPWNDDLILFNATSSVDYNVGFYGPETFVAQWTDVANWIPVAGGDGGVGSFTFQCVLYSSAHPTLPNHIEFRYDRTTAPPVMAPCVAYDPTVPTTSSNVATSATVGTDSASGSSVTNIGVDATDRGAANSVYPACDIRLIPTTFLGGHAAFGGTITPAPADPWCSIVGLPGTMAIPPACITPPCRDDENFGMAAGALIPLPWKVFLGGHYFRHANMNSNGFLQLGSGSYFTNAVNAALPGTAEPDATFAPFWDDLETTGPMGMYVRIDGVPGCRVMTFEWNGMTKFTAPGGDCAGDGSVSFQVKIYEGGADAPQCAPGPPGLGTGRDLVEYHYDHAGFVPPVAPFTATIGWENYKGTVGGSLGGAVNPGPPVDPLFGPAKVVVDQCDCGTVRYYGNPSALNSACLPEIKTNCVPPRIGNLFGLQIVGGTAGGFGLFAFSFAPPLAPTKIGVPCGGLPIGPLSVWVNPVGLIFVGCGPLPGAVAPTPPSPCEGCCSLTIPIPPDPIFVCAHVFAQGVVFGPGVGGPFIELTEGAKITLGP